MREIDENISNQMKQKEFQNHQCCFTGHRPEKLKLAEKDVKKNLGAAICQAVDDCFTTFITGMARGVDTWAGQIVLRLR